LALSARTVWIWGQSHPQPLACDRRHMPKTLSSRTCFGFWTRMYFNCSGDRVWEPHGGTHDKQESRRLAKPRPEPKARAEFGWRRRPEPSRHARHCWNIGMYWSLRPAIPCDCDCVRSGDLLFEILYCPTVWIRSDMRVVRGTMLYGTWQTIVAQQVKSRNRSRTRPCMWKAARTVRAPGKSWQSHGQGLSCVERHAC